MSSVVTGLALLASLAIVTLLGQWLRHRLPDHHLSADSRDAVKLAVGLVATMTALILGLLAFAAKGTNDSRRAEVIAMAAKVHMLDHMLADYGPGTAEARARLREAVADYVRYAGSEEVGNWAQMAPIWQANNRLYAAVLGLSPHDDAQRDLKVRAATVTMDVGQLRMLLLAQRVPSLPKPLLLAVICWLVAIFFSFSLLAPRNATAGLALLAAALSVASAVFLIMELDRPLGGMISISTGPMLDSLHLPRP